MKKTQKRAAYLAMAAQVYYVLGSSPKGKPIAEPGEVPAECGVMLATETGLEVARVAPRQAFTGLRFDVWMALAKAAPLPRGDDERQMSL